MAGLAIEGAEVAAPLIEKGAGLALQEAEVAAPLIEEGAVTAGKAAGSFLSRTASNLTSGIKTAYTNVRNTNMTSATEDIKTHLPQIVEGVGAALTVADIATNVIPSRKPEDTQIKSQNNNSPGVSNSPESKSIAEGGMEYESLYNMYEGSADTKEDSFQLMLAGLVMVLVIYFFYREYKYGQAILWTLLLLWAGFKSGKVLLEHFSH
jgi:hypothetical protein